MNSFAATAAELRKTVTQCQPMLAELANLTTSDRPQPAKWSKKEILGHLLDSASNNHQRFVRAALQGNLVFPGYDQAPLVELQRFRSMEWKFLVEFWAAYNLFLAHVISALPADAATAMCAIGKNQPATLEWVAEDYVAHLKHHLNQILDTTFATSYGARA
ncbi:MAG TPA: DinB family protein [Candidatus Angelobacter sp.]